MDISRAKEILQSPERVEVKYRGVPVWIQYIDETAEKALVYPEGSPDEEKIVPVWDLDER
ncbi:H-type small acid-soluble spore protein [Lihuaxuella thermophila]|uniref:Small acid-soluble spore protein H (Minor) n=1 Tax=Lihuaxuella thermophila TaxID=1173111 RepID=A0A1H8FVT9_9BACL|nr:H-type small acid-soluble spore protein [Lihuaxuella thermophila]SEN35665.1 small acid-soluble spore protein H (minor) [Lihuaxuella thermophila]